MTTCELIEKVAAALVADATLHDWCEEKFGKAPLILLGIDERSPLDDEDYPVIPIVGISEERGEPHDIWTLVLRAGVRNETITTIGGIRTMEGFLQAEEMRGLVQEAIKMARVLPCRSTGGAATIACTYPIFESVIEIRFRSLADYTR